MESKKLTNVQKSVMERFSCGQRLVFLETNRRSGDAIFWVRETNSGYHTIVEKALYPQLRRLLWDELISMNNHDQVLNPEELRIESDSWEWIELHRAGCIGY